MRRLASRAWPLAVAVAVLILLALAVVLVHVGGRQPEPGHAQAPAATSPTADAEPQNAGPPETAERPDPERTRVAGRVVDQAGQPIPGARVSWQPGGATEILSEVLSLRTDKLSGCTTTDGNGGFSFTVEDPVAGQCLSLLASADGYLNAGKIVTLQEEGLESGEFVLKPACAIAGRVVDINRRPIPGIVVSAWGGSPGQSRTRDSLPSDSVGGFAVENLGQGGDLTLTAKSVSRSPGDNIEQGVPLAMAKRPLLVLTLREGERRDNIELVVPWDWQRTIDGVVVDESGNALPDADVRAETSSTGRSRLAATTSDGQGRFHLEGIIDAVTDDAPEIEFVDIHCQLAGYEPACVEKIAVGERNAQVILLQARRGAIEGVVLDAASRKPVTDAQVHLWQVDCEWGEKWNPRGVLNSNAESGAGKVSRRAGRFSIPDVRAGHATLIAFSPRHGISTEHDVTVREGETTEVEILMPTAGVLEIQVVYTGQMAGRTAECLVTCYPAGQIGLSAGYSPWLQDMLATGKRPGPIREHPEATYTMTLAPGLYDIVVGSKTSLSDAGVAPSRNYRTASAQVSAGTTTAITVEIGGTGTLQGYAPRQEDEDKVYVFLTPGDDVSTLGESTTPHVLAERLGRVQQAYTCKDVYLLNCIPIGTYTVTAMGRLKDGGYRFRGSEQVNIAEPDQIVTVDFY